MSNPSKKYVEAFMRDIQKLCKKYHLKLHGTCHGYVTLSTESDTELAHDIKITSNEIKKTWEEDAFREKKMQKFHVVYYNQHDGRTVTREVEEDIDNEDWYTNLEWTIQSLVWDNDVEIYGKRAAIELESTEDDFHWKVTKGMWYFGTITVRKIEEAK